MRAIDIEITCTYERSFSVLRRLKNYTKITMAQNHLRDLTVLNCHKTTVEPLHEIENTFINKCSTKKNIFPLK